MCGNCSGDHKYADCPIIDLQFAPTKKEYEVLKEGDKILQGITTNLHLLKYGKIYDWMFIDRIKRLMKFEQRLR